MFEYHNTNINFAKSKYRIQNVNYISHAKKHVYNYSSFFFMNYVIISISLFDWEITSCLNTNENVFLCDRDFLFNRNINDFVHRFKFIIIIKIVDIQICDKYINTKVLLNLNKISVQIKTYLINNFQSSFIINMNVLNKNNINFLLIRQTLKIKNIEILLCYTSSTSFTSFITQSNVYINWIFYHFMIYTINYNITLSYIRKWKFISRFIIESKLFSFSINEKINRSNFATSSFLSSFLHEFFTIVSHMKNTLILNKKFVDSKIMYHSTEFKINSFKNINVVFFDFFRKCRYCKQFFIFKIFFISISHIATKISKNSSVLKSLTIFEKSYQIDDICLIFHVFLLIFTNCTNWIMIIDNKNINTFNEQLIRFRRCQNHENAIIFSFFVSMLLRYQVLNFNCLTLNFYFESTLLWIEYLI